MKKVILVYLWLFFFTAASAGISTKKQDILKLIGTSYAPNGKFAWIELNGEDYGWTREGGNVGRYRIVLSYNRIWCLMSWKKAAYLVD